MRPMLVTFSHWSPRNVTICTMSQTVGFIGLGVMGRPMAGFLLDDLKQRGGTLLVNNNVREPAEDLIARGAEWCATGGEMARRADIIVFMVPDLPQVKSVVYGEDGILEAGEPVTIVVCSTTSALGLVEFGATIAAQSGGLIKVVDAPVSGGQTGAEAGTLSIMVGGDDEVVAPVLDLLSACGTTAHMGELGTGQITKACNQMIVSATVIALSEASTLAEAAGIDVAKMFELLQGGYAGSTIMKDKATRFATHDHSPSGPAKFMIKDLGSALDISTAFGLYTPQTELSRREFTQLTDAGMGDLDTAVMQAWLESQRRPPAMSKHLVIMGPSGVGKTTTARLLAKRLGWPYVEGDTLHPESNREKMAAGIPLDDEDRWPWLDIIATFLSSEAKLNSSTVVTCSALKRSYRDRLRKADGEVTFVHLNVPSDELARRMAARRGHYMPASLLESQLATLEPLGEDESGVKIKATGTPEMVVQNIIDVLGLHPKR